MSRGEGSAAEGELGTETSRRWADFIALTREHGRNPVVDRRERWNQAEPRSLGNILGFKQSFQA